MANISDKTSYQEFENWDSYLESVHQNRYKSEIAHFKKTIELIITFFNATIRNGRDTKKKHDMIQLVTTRIVGDCRSAFSLLLKGYYPQSAGLTRGAIESIFLIYDFKVNPENEDLWADAGKGKREKLFKASKVRERLEGKSALNVKAAKEIYSLISDWAIHANIESYLWNIEAKDDKTFFHFTGQENKIRADFGIFTLLNSTGFALMVLADEDLYTFKDMKWLLGYSIWRKEHCRILNKAAVEVFKIKDFKPLQPKLPKLIIADK